MLSILKSMSLQGLDGYLINVQVDISQGIPCWDIVGLPDTSIKESRERVQIALKNSGYEVRAKKIIINLAPANTRKEGSFLDLPIALGILMNLKQIINRKMEDTIFLGELSFNGKINRVKGILPICIEAKKIGIKKVVIPIENYKEASIVEGIEIIGVSDLKEVIKYVNNNVYKKMDKTVNKTIPISEYNIDFADIKGQESAKRAMEIVASGLHNCLLIGSPGSGKTMLAKSLATILPDLSFDESMEITKIYSIAGKLSKYNPIMEKRPYRAPHHTISKSALIGGGKNPKPGEISLAHNGVLFLDELTEFNRSTLEVLREPLEDKEINISRVTGNYKFPANFIFIASTNPCPCGYYGAQNNKCTCSKSSIKKYLNKISGPLLDRIDLHIETSQIDYWKLEKDISSEKSEEIKKRVNKAKTIQKDRYKKESISSNSELNNKLISKYCKLDSDGKKIIKNAYEKLGLSTRAYFSILKVARTIADLEEKENISTFHLFEAIQYRSLDEKYWRK